MEISDECWDQVSPLLMNCTSDGNIGNTSGNVASGHGGYGCSSEELLVAGQATTGTSPPLGTSASSLSPGSSSAGVAPGAVSPNGSAAPGPGSTASGTSCCENGRPIMTDPVSGQTVCSCQYDSARLTLSYPRLSTSGVGVYGTPYPSTDQNPYPSIGVDSSAFYSPLSNPYALKDGGSSTDMSAWTSAGLQTTTGYYPYDPTLAAYGYGAGYDLAARRKNATRESTATLKAWLNEHKKNPYPTKGEKIMLAIITKMTLTQVSTWFANARRRLKKENKMTWEPKNKTDDDDDAIVSDSDEKDKDDLSFDADKMKDRLRDDKDGLHHVKIENRHDKDLDDDDETDEEDRKPDGLGLTSHHHLHHHSHMHHNMLGGLKDEIKSQECGIPIPATKPKIWSVVDTAACKTPPPPQQQPWLMPNTSCGGATMGGMNMSMNSFALPSTTMSPATGSAAPYSRYSGFLGHYNGNSHGAMGNYNTPSGFPEVQTDTPPQTPPNMKLPSVANNIINSNSCFGSSNINHHSQQPQSSSYHHNSFVNNFNRMQPNQLSPQKERQDFQQQQSMRSAVNPSQQPQHQVNPNEGTAFKPFFKSSPPLNNGFVSPV